MNLRNAIRGSAFCVLHSAFIVLPSSAVTRPFHVTLESAVQSSSPVMSRFGTIKADLYAGGFRIETIWLRGFSRNGSRSLTVENPVSRTYVKMPMSDVPSMIRSLGGRATAKGPPRKIEITSGTVAHIAAQRYRLLYDGGEFIDVWTTSALGPTPEFRSFIDEFVLALYPQAAAAFRGIPGTPIYVEMNMGEYRKLVVVHPTRVLFSNAGESQALRVSPWMFPAPFGTIFK